MHREKQQWQRESNPWHSQVEQRVDIWPFYLRNHLIKSIHEKMRMKFLLYSSNENANGEAVDNRT